MLTSSLADSTKQLNRHADVAPPPLHAPLFNYVVPTATTTEQVFAEQGYFCTTPDTMIRFCGNSCLENNKTQASPSYVGASAA